MSSQEALILLDARGTARGSRAHPAGRSALDRERPPCGVPHSHGRLLGLRPAAQLDDRIVDLVEDETITRICIRFSIS